MAWDHGLVLPSTSETPLVSLWACKTVERIKHSLLNDPVSPTDSPRLISQRVGAPPGKHGRHALHDALDAGGLLDDGARLSDAVHQPVEHHDHAVVVFGGRHLEELAARGQGQQPALFAKDRAAVVKVPLVTHDGDGHLLQPHVFLGGLDALDEPSHHVETGPVADAVHQHEAICPLQSLLTQGGTGGNVLLR